MSAIKNLLAVSLLSAQITAFSLDEQPFLMPDELSKVAYFLVEEALYKGNNEFSTVDGFLPRGYYTNNIEYWGEYKKPKSVKMVLKTGDERGVPGNNPLYSLLGKMNNRFETRAALSQIERLYAHSGADLYDGATWQMASALLYKRDAETLPSDNKDAKAPRNPLTVIQNQTDRLSKMDALANGSLINYGSGNQIIRNRQYTLPLSKQGFERTADEPLWQTRHQAYVDYSSIEDSKKGKISWPDYKIETADAAWQLLALLQVYNDIADENEFADDQIKNVLYKLSALQSLQTKEGGFWRVANGSLKNPTTKYNAERASLADNAVIFSLLNTLEYTLSRKVNSEQETSPFIETSLNVVRIMLHGGSTPLEHQTKGLFHYFESQLAGLNAQENAMDTADILWPMLALGVERVAVWSDKSPIELWRSLKHTAGYYDNNGMLLGLRYQPKNKNTLSAELSLGAILHLRDLMRIYNGHNDEIKELRADLDAIQQGVKALLSDNYLNDNNFNQSLADHYQTKLPPSSLAMLEANIPYNKQSRKEVGYIAQPLPHVASTAWSVIVHYDYNPFIPEGSVIGYQPQQPITPDNHTIHYPEHELTVMNVYKRDKASSEYDSALIAEWASLDDEEPVWQPWITNPIAIGSLASVKLPEEVIHHQSGLLRFIAKDENGHFDHLACEARITENEFSQLFGKDYPLNMAMAIESIDPNDPSQPGRCFILPEL